MDSHQRIGQSIQDSEITREIIIQANEIAIKICEGQKFLASIIILLDCTLIELIEFIREVLQFEIDLQKGIQSHKYKNMIFKYEDYSLKIDIIRNLINAAELEFIIFKEIQYELDDEVSTQNSDGDSSVILFIRELISREEYELKLDSEISLGDLSEFMKLQLGFMIDLKKGFQSIKIPELIFRSNFWKMHQISKILNSSIIYLNIQRQQCLLMIEIDVFDQIEHIEIDDQTTIQKIIEFFTDRNKDKSNVYCYDVNNKLLDKQDINAKCSSIEIKNDKRFLKLTYRLLC